MFALRKLLSSTPSRPVGRAVRWNATLPSISQESPPLSASSVSAPTEQDKTQGRRRRKIPPKRPNISLVNKRVWNDPLGVGVVPAYDLALQIIATDSQQLKAQLGALRAEIEEKETIHRALEENSLLPEEEMLRRKEQLDQLDEEIEEMMKKANIVEIQSEVNIPAVRWNVNNAMANMSILSHRHLLEQKWRKDGDLDLLMERLHQMHVVPDALPEIRPSIDLHVITRTTPSVFLESKKVQVQVIPGTFLRPKQTLFPPKLRVNVFHSDVRLYTMLLVDLDVPHPGSQGYTTYLHWLKPNIPLSATSSNRLTNLNSHTRYIPPHPQRGSLYHRYVTLLLPQPPISKYSLTTAARAAGSTSVHLDIPVLPDENRNGFDIREFARTWGLDAGNGGGAHMWREVWDNDVSSIYRDILKNDEPRYSRPPKVDVYAELKQKKKYTL